MKIKTKDLSGAQLDWAVATSLGMDAEIWGSGSMPVAAMMVAGETKAFRLDGDPDMAVVILEREGMIPILNPKGDNFLDVLRNELRKIVVRHMGDQVEIPNEEGVQDEQ